MTRAAKVALALSPLLPPLLLPGVGTLVSVVIVALVLLVHKPSRAPTLRLFAKPRVPTVLAGLATGLALAAVFWFAIEPLIERMVEGEIDLDAFAGVEGNLANYLLLLALGLGFGGIVEEVIFRGFVIGWGSAILGERAGLPLAVLSAAVFGIAHLYQGWAGVITTGLAGLALGLLYLANRKGLAAPILAHMAMNFVGVTLIYLGLDG